jgi:hypothetical protein
MPVRSVCIVVGALSIVSSSVSFAKSSSEDRPKHEKTWCMINSGPQGWLKYVPCWKLG